MDEILQIEQIVCEKGNPPQPVINGLTFSIEEGGSLVLMGPSGCGKSTVLRTIIGLDPLSSGDIYFENRSISAWPIHELRQRVGMVFQLPYLFSGTVADNILFGPRLRRQPVRDEDAFVNRALNDVGLPGELAGRRSDQLSVGQQMRVSLARTLVNEPKCLLLDEPTASLDHESEEQLLEQIFKLHERGMTLLTVTHSSKVANDLPGDIIKMSYSENANSQSTSMEN